VQTPAASGPSALSLSPPGDPLPERVKNVPAKGSGSGVTLPDIEQIAWERNARGGFEAWLNPGGPTTPRRDRVYLGYLGKRSLHLPPDEIKRWVAGKRSAKNV